MTNQGPSPWDDVPRIEQGPMLPPPMITPDMTYPSYPNPAGLGLQIPFPDGEPEVVPVPAMPMMPMIDQDPNMSPWALMNGLPGE